MSEADGGGDANDDRANDDRANDDRANDDRANDDRANDDRANDDRVDDDRVDDERADDSVTAGTALFFFMLAEFAALVYYMYISRPMWFFLDEWDFLANRTAFNVHDLFVPHNEHWVTLPTLAYRGLWWIFGLRTYRPYQLLIVLMHLALAFLLRALMRRVGVRPWTATVVASMLVLFGSGYQDIVLPSQITLVGSVLFGLVHLRLAGHDGPLDRRDYLGLAAGLAALMCSGVGVSMVIAVGVAVLITRGWRRALIHTVPPAAAYMVWFAAIGHQGYKSSNKQGGLGDIARFVRVIVAATFGAVGHYRGLGVVLGVLLVGGLVLAWRPLPVAELRSRAAAPVGLLVGAFSLLCITGYGRGGQHTFTEKSRYLYLVFALLLPALAIAADAVMRRWRVVTPAVAVLLVVGIPGNLNVIADYMHKPIVVKQAAYRHMMLSLPRVAAAKEVSRATVPDQELAHFVTIGWLLDGAASGRIPKPKHISSADATMDAIRLSFQQSPALLLPSYACANLAKTSLVFHLKRGQSILVRSIGKQAEIVPPTFLPVDVFRFYPITVAGPTLTAQRPVSFRVIDVGRAFSQVCAPAPLMAAARVDATR